MGHDTCALLPNSSEEHTSHGVFTCREGAVVLKVGSLEEHQHHQEWERNTDFGDPPQTSQIGGLVCSDRPSRGFCCQVLNITDTDRMIKEVW